MSPVHESSPVQSPESSFCTRSVATPLAHALRLNKEVPRGPLLGFIWSKKMMSGAQKRTLSQELESEDAKVAALN